MARALKPIIIIKKVSGHGGHHGGAWKVAYADFVTAMMALFIVLWLLSSSAKVKKAVAGYFNDPKSSQKETGTSKTGDDDAIPVDQKNVQKLKEQIEKAIQERKDLEKLAKQIEITITPEGLRIELIEDKNGTFFQSGSAKLSDDGQQLLAMLAGQLKPLPNHLLLEGHTDATPYSADTGYTNWELSADRANSARRLLQSDGVGQQQISQVRGYADQLLRVKNDPLDPSNRRISLIVQWVTTAEPPSKNIGGGPGQESGKDLGSEIGKADAAKSKAAEGKSAGTPSGAASPNTAKPAGVSPAQPASASGKPPTAADLAAKPAAGKPSLFERLKSKLPGAKPKQ
jgi:chemotaxis protein MotB